MFVFQQKWEKPRSTFKIVICCKTRLETQAQSFALSIYVVFNNFFFWKEGRDLIETLFSYSFFFKKWLSRHAPACWPLFCVFQPLGGGLWFPLCIIRVWEKKYMFLVPSSVTAFWVILAMYKKTFKLKETWKLVIRSDRKTPFEEVIINHKGTRMVKDG